MLRFVVRSCLLQQPQANDGSVLLSKGQQAKQAKQQKLADCAPRSSPCLLSAHTVLEKSNLKSHHSSYYTTDPQARRHSDSLLRLPVPIMGNRASREANAGSPGAGSAAAAAADTASAAASQRPTAAPTPGPLPAECPVPAEFREKVYKNPAVYNVYNQRINDPSAPAATASPLAALPGQDLIDPLNNMPLEPNQQPCPGQRKLLSTERQVSNIPKGGTDATWLYPSPQMFFNGKAAGRRPSCGMPLQV